MTIRLIIPLIAAGAVSPPAVAQADYRISQRKAESFTRSDAKDRYGDSHGVIVPSAHCRPQGRPPKLPSEKGPPSYGGRHHRWSCTWGEGGEALDGNRACVGVLLIAGSSAGGDDCQSKVMRGVRCWAD